MATLVELHGNGISDQTLWDPTGLSNYDAGVLWLAWFQNQVDKGNISLNALSGKCDWWDLLCKGGQAVDWVGEKGKAVLDYTGEKIGEGVRLLTDEEVRDGVKDYASAYATGGGSVALENSLSQILGKDTNPQDFLSMLGSIFKGSPGTGVNRAGLGEFNVDPKTLLIGAGVVISGLLLIKVVSN